MNKAFYIAAIVLSIAFLIVVGVYIDMVESERMSYLLNSYSYDPYNPYTSYSSAYSYDYGSDYTFEGALISLLFILFFLTTDLLGLMKVKTKTTKILSIIGLSIGGIFLFVDVIMILSPDSASFDEGGASLLLYGLIVLAFSIIGLIQSVRYSNQKNGVKNPSADLLDS